MLRHYVDSLTTEGAHKTGHYDAERRSAPRGRGTIPRHCSVLVACHILRLIMFLYDSCKNVCMIIRIMIHIREWLT